MNPSPALRVYQSLTDAMLAAREFDIDQQMKADFWPFADDNTEPFEDQMLDWLDYLWYKCLSKEDIDILNAESYQRMLRYQEQEAAINAASDSLLGQPNESIPPISTL